MKDCLAEHQMFAHGSQRLVFKEPIALLSKEALEAMKNPGDQKVPTINFLINLMLPYVYRGKLYLLISFESKKVCVFDCETGLFDDEISFMESYDATELPLEDE